MVDRAVMAVMAVAVVFMVMVMVQVMMSVNLFLPCRDGKLMFLLY